MIHSQRRRGVPRPQPARSDGQRHLFQSSCVALINVSQVPQVARRCVTVADMSSAGRRSHHLCKGVGTRDYQVIFRGVEKREGKPLERQQPSMMRPGAGELAEPSLPHALRYGVETPEMRSQDGDRKIGVGYHLENLLKAPFSSPPCDYPIMRNQNPERSKLHAHSCKLVGNEAEGSAPAEASPSAARIASTRGSQSCSRAASRRASARSGSSAIAATTALSKLGTSAPT